ncbi:hypothetical protein LZ31DRAFT_609184 [Colletotrichum somersetense]|nr:hypothetical protein LZ31DRAFT_609184 [Colletotrichum somersetense]
MKWFYYSANRHLYSAISNFAAPRDDKELASRRRYVSKTTIWAFVMGLIWSASLAAVFEYSKSPLYNYDATDYRTKQCGKTAAEARARGCHFDPVSFAWLPERCLDQELADEFRALNWTLYADVHATRVKTEKEFSDGLTDTFLTNENHELHCVYSWRRLHRLIQAGKPLHSGLSYDHTKHCGSVLTSHRPPKEIITKALVIYPAC